MAAPGRRGAPRGFSLIEFAVVAAIGTIVAGLTFAALGGLKTAARYSTAAAEMVVGLRQARAEAIGRGNNVAFVVDTVGGRWWMVEDVFTDFSLDVFDPANPAPAPDHLLDSGVLPDGSSFGPPGGYGTALPRPFSWVPVSTAMGASFPYCSFCRTSGTNTGFGAVVFQPGAGTIFTAGPATLGQQLSVATDIQGPPIHVTTIAIATRTSTIQWFETWQP